MHRRKLLLCAIVAAGVIILFPSISPVHSSVPSSTNWTGFGAMAYWNIKNSTGATVATLEVVLAEQELDNSGNPDPAKTNMLYISAYQPINGSGGISETAAYGLPFTWTNIDYAYVNALNLNFTWENRTSLHNLTIIWNAAPQTPLTCGKYTNRTGDLVVAPGIWRSSNAQITISDETGSASYTSDWAIIGINMLHVGTYRDWQVALFRDRLYIFPPQNLPNMPLIQSPGMWDPTYYNGLSWTPVDAAKYLVDECMSNSYLT